MSWELKSLGEFCHFQRGHDLPKTKMKDGVIPVAGSNGIIGYHDVATTKGPGITIGRSGNIGTPKFYKHDFWAHNTVLYVKDFNGNNPLFTYYLLHGIDFNGFNTGSAVPSLNRNHIHELELRVPSLPEQKAIASVLSSLDDKIDLLHRQNKTLEAMAETLFRQWFIEEAKEDWEEFLFSDFFKVKHGHAFKGEFITPEKCKYHLVTPGNFEIGGGFKSSKFKYYSSEEIPKDYIFDELDFIVTMTDLSKEGDTLGYPAFIPLHDQNDIVYLHNQRVGKVLFDNSVASKFFFYLLMKQDVYQQFIVGSCTGTSVKHTSPSTIGSFTFKKAPNELLWEFDQIVQKQFSRIFLNQKQIQTLEKLRDTLLPKLMSGEVRVQFKD